MQDVKAHIEVLKNKLPLADQQIVDALAPSGKLRAGINLSNFLLVTGRTDDGVPEGVSPGMAIALAEVIGREVEFVTYESPGAVADAAQEDEWDIGNIGADPARAEFISFTNAYCEIESTCLVPLGSNIKSFTDVDQPGIRIATKKRAAYTLWLGRNLKHAELKQFESIDASFDAFVAEGFEVLAGLRPRLLEDEKRLSGSRILSDRFAVVQQAIGTPSNRNASGAKFLQKFVSAAKEIGLVQALIDQHAVTGKLSVAQG